MTVAHTPTPYTAFVATAPTGAPDKPTLFQELIDDGTVPNPVGTPDTMRTDVDDAVAAGATPTASQLDLVVIFPSTLSGAEITAYDAVIAAHDGVPDPDASLAIPRIFQRAGEPNTTTDDDTFGTGQSPRGGFRFGDEWHNTSDDQIYRCVDATTGAPKWDLLTAFGSVRASDIASLTSVFDQGSPPAADQQLLTDGSGDVTLEARDEQDLSNDPLSSTTSSTFVDRIDSSPTLDGGDYVITGYAELGGANPEVQILIETTIEAILTTAGTFSPSKAITLASGARRFQMQWRKVSGGGTADITRARIFIRKVRD